MRSERKPDLCTSGDGSASNDEDKDKARFALAAGDNCGVFNDNEDGGAVSVPVVETDLSEDEEKRLVLGAGTGTCGICKGGEDDAQCISITGACAGVWDMDKEEVEVGSAGAGDCSGGEKSVLGAGAGAGACKIGKETMLGDNAGWDIVI
ncbi:hypothetical protein GYMLUDRAFT_251632 [Collybiopsis luxurians FD-317 M1]|uniref:Uncharacterized protein n=1 Tax=Collybiopsis luxurians FD-317 M1 TaxID=944289 RepID=A0A0D0C290_9AGAR|nr:hypothetical protein GYMLUDRAFT_251632 [Collybiopsis luxurians FD-317 M1]